MFNLSSAGDSGSELTPSEIHWPASTNDLLDKITILSLFVEWSCLLVKDGIKSLYWKPIKSQLQQVMFY